MAGTRKVIDCRDHPAAGQCTLAMSGSEEEVIELAVLHATTVHGYTDTPELRQQLRSMLKNESDVRSTAA